MSDTDEKQRPLTWGERMAERARWLAGLRRPRQPWLKALQKVEARSRAEATHTPTRFRRVEVTQMAAPRRPADFSVEESVPPVEEAPLTEGATLGGDLRQRLRAALGADPASARVHTDAPADALARHHRADAVTVGNDIFFREGRFQPHDPRGFALLAHEASHVIEAKQPFAEQRRASSAEVRAEEHRALTVERRVLGAPPVSRLRLPPVGARQPAPRAVAPEVPKVALTPPSTPAPSRPMTAAGDRFEDQPGSNQGIDVDGIKRAIYADLMQQIRTDFERGG